MDVYFGWVRVGGGEQRYILSEWWWMYISYG